MTSHKPTIFELTDGKWGIHFKGLHRTEVASRVYLMDEVGRPAGDDIKEAVREMLSRPLVNIEAGAGGIVVIAEKPAEIVERIIREREVQRKQR